MNTHIVTLILLIALTVSCKKEETAAPAAPAVDTTAVLVMQTKACARLYTTEYRIHKLITHSDDKRLVLSLFGKEHNVQAPFSERRIAIPMDMTLKAYIDFEQFGAGNIARSDSQIVITLPDPHIVATASRIDQQGIRQYNDIGRGSFSDAEISSYQQQGADSILAHIRHYGLLEAARLNAAKVLLPILHRMGYTEKNAVVRFRSDLSQTDLRSLTTLTKTEEK